MTVSKVLLVPSELISSYSRRELSRWHGVIGNLRRLRFKEAQLVARRSMLCTEVQHYGDLPKVLGPENVFIVGKYYMEYILANLPPDTRYPSLHKTPKGTHINLKEALSLLPSVDAVVIGVRSGAVGEAIRKAAIKQGAFVALIDYFDHLEVYNDPNMGDGITRGYRLKQDFNLFFKHDIPLSVERNDILPVAPMPVRPESYEFDLPMLKGRDISVFYRGQKRPGVLRDDRTEIAELIEARIPGAKIENQNQMWTETFHGYAQTWMRSKFGLSPAGKVWDSTRHCETAMFGCVPIMPTPNCRTVNNLVRSDENAVVYRAERNADGIFKVVNGDEVIERIRYLLDNDDAMTAVAEEWSREVRTHHTTEARARYLVSEIERRL